MCDLVPGLLDDFKAAWADDLPNVNTYTDYREMLAREELDILTVATSDNRHTDIVVDGANASVKGILCEKPLATSLEDADRMIEACRRARYTPSRRPQSTVEPAHSQGAG